MDASGSAVGDSGATRTLLTEEAAKLLRLKEWDPRVEMNVEYGGGDRGRVSKVVKLGEVEALVVPNLQDNLVSLGDFAERGSSIVLTANGGVVRNPFNDKEINLKWESGTWRIFLRDVAGYDHESGSRNVKAFVSSSGKSKLERYISLHERSCHQSADTLIKALEADPPCWIRSGITAQEIREVAKKYTCVPCVLAKRRSKSVAFNLVDPDGFSGGINSKNAEPGQIISMDPVGPISPKSIGGFSLMWVVYDYGSAYTWVFFTDNKRAATVVKILEFVMVDLRFWERRLKIVRSDAEDVFTAAEVQSFLDKEGVKHQTSVPYAHYQNRVEKSIQEVVRGVSSMMCAQKWLPASYWEHAARHFVRVSNYVPTRKTKKSTPAKLIGAGDLDLSVRFLFAFGDFVAVRIPEPEVKWKFDLRRDLGIYLGDADGTKRGSLVLSPTTGAVHVRLDCVKLELTDEMLHKYYDARLSSSDARPIMQKVQDAVVDFEDNAWTRQLQEEEAKSIDHPITATWSDLDGGKAHGGEDGAEATSSVSTSTGQPVQSAKVPAVKKTYRYLRHNPREMRASVVDSNASGYGLVHPFVRDRVFGLGAKLTVGKVLKTAEAQYWVDALHVEINQMLDTGTLEAVLERNVPKEASVINSTMVLKKKPDKYKARLCACGNELKNQIAETYSPTIGALTYSVLHQLCIIDRMEVRIIDTVGAFLYQVYPDKEAPIYVRMPAKVMEACGIPPGTVYKVKKYIYGLPDSGRAYYLAYAKLLMSAGYCKSRSDPCLFLKVNEAAGERVYVWIHVDDTFVAATSKKLLDELETVIKRQYKVTVKTQVDSYLGVHFQYLPNGDVKITQPQLLQGLLEEYKEELEKHRAREPMAPMRLESARSKSQEPMDPTEYLHLEGALIYLTKSRPDIQTAVSFGATHSVSPTRGDFDELIHCLKYLESTQDAGLVLKAGEPGRDLVLKCYVDASYLTHPDSKSHQGFCLSFGDIGTFYSKSSKQQLVSTSSTQSEVRALQTAVVEILFIIELCKELCRPIKLPVIVFEDNAAVIALSREMTSRAKRCKHFLMAISWIREQVEAKLIELQKVSDEENRADTLTKITTGVRQRSRAEELLGSKLTDAKDTTDDFESV